MLREVGFCLNPGSLRPLVRAPRMHCWSQVDGTRSNSLTAARRSPFEWRAGKLNRRRNISVPTLILAGITDKTGTWGTTKFHI
jgi:hypothetical protein